MSTTRAIAELQFPLHRPDMSDMLRRGDAKINALMAGDRRVLAADEVLVEAEAGHDYVYRLIDGWATRIRTLTDGRSQSILLFLPGDLFAIKSMYLTHHTDGIEMLTRGVALRVNQRTLRDACDRDPDISIRCTWQVIEEERRLHNWMIALGIGSAEERLARLLIDTRGRLALAEKIGADDMTFEMPMTQAQIGEHIGMSIVHVNRMLKQFREQDIVTKRGKTVVIRDLKTLSRIAMPLLDVAERKAPYLLGSAKSSN